MANGPDEPEFPSWMLPEAPTAFAFQVLLGGAGVCTAIVSGSTDRLLVGFSILLLAIGIIGLGYVSLVRRRARQQANRS